MITPLQLIVLNTRPYKETSLLVNTYTDVLGRADFVVNGVRTPRNRAAAAVFHPFSILDSQAYISDKKELHRLKEYKKTIPLHGLCTDVRKSSIGLFMAELVYRTVRESEENRDLYHFLKETIVQLDCAGEELPDVHVYFTVRLCRYLGYAPRAEGSSAGYFDIRKGSFTPFSEQANSPGRQTDTFDKEDSCMLHKILLCPPGTYQPLTCTGAQRYKFLNSMIGYYGYHMGRSPQIK
ncbi:MAG TPA: DNA repair protein RecO, partial [Bacteroidales bacterium]|nr:DNA repair protein RecO [Bacteroidales bacterium]